MRNRHLPSLFNVAVKGKKHQVAGNFQPTEFIQALSKVFSKGCILSDC